MAQASFRSWIGVAKDTINANLTSAVATAATSLPITNTVGTTPLTSAGATYSAIIVDGVNTETTVLTGNLTAGAIACTALANAHGQNVYVYFQLTASIGPTAYIPVTKIDWQDDYAQIYDKNLRGSNTDVFGAVQGMRHATLGLEGDVFADSFGYLLASYFGAYDYSATGGSLPTTYAFSQLNTGNAQPTPYLYYDYNPATSNTRVLAKAVVSDLTVKADPGGALGHTTNIMAFASGVVANPATIPPAYSAFKIVPSWKGSVSIGGTFTGKVQNYELSLKRADAGPINTLQGIQDPIAIFVGAAQCSVKTTIVVDDDVQLLNYINGSQPSFKLTATQGATTAANGITVQNTLANYENVKVAQTGGAYVTIDVPFTAIANSTDASTAGAGLSPCKFTLSTGTTTGATLY